MNTGNPILLISLVLFVGGFAAGYLLPSSSASFVLYHIGGLGAVGLLATLSGVVALRKGYAFWRVFLTSILLAILLGISAAFLVPPSNMETRPAACGGSVSLAVGVLILIIMVFVKKKVVGGYT
jgi:hypothetical protein